MAAASFQKDADELLRLAQLTERQNIRHILSAEAEKLKSLAEQEEKKALKTATVTVPRKTVLKSKIDNYAWDQSDKYLKFYVTIDGVQNLPAENITTEYNAKHFEMSVLLAENKCSALNINNLLHEIVPSESYHKVKTDMVAVYLKKLVPQHWSYITETEKKAKEPKTPKLEKEQEQDPSASLMTLMKQMYDDGDDDMKRTIAKAWTEARDKKSPEEPF